jgi:DNA-binding beta-propeller fold protein YncE
VTTRAPADTSVLVLSEDESTIWALGKTLAKIDASTGATLARSNQVGGPWPRFHRGDVALSPDERTLYINDTKRRELIAVDAVTLRVRQRVRIARQVWGIATHPSNGNVWAITSELLPRVPVTLPPDLPAEIWTFNPRLRKSGQIMMPSPGAAEALNFDPTGAKAYVTFRYYPRPSEILILPAATRS